MASSFCTIVVNRTPYTRCGAEKKSWQLACLDHWRQVPKPLQDEVWRLYKSEQGSGRHLAAVAECRKSIEPPLLDRDDRAADALTAV